MRKTYGIPVLVMLAILLGALPTLAGDLKGTVKLGMISFEEEDGSHRATMPETWNFEDGFAVSRVDLYGRLGERSNFHLDVHEANLASRRGLFTWRMADLGQLTVRHNNYKRIYDATGDVTSERKDWNFGANITPNEWLRITGVHNMQWRDGQREGLPAGNGSVLGGEYDYMLKTGVYEVEAHKDGRVLALGWQTSSLADDLYSAADRTGNVYSVRASAPCMLLPHLNHFVRASYGKQELDEAALDYTLSTFEYLGIYRPQAAWQVRYRLNLDRIENTSTDLQTDNVRNDVDATWYYGKGQITTGAGYVTRDDDVTLTDGTVWRAAATFNEGRALQAKVSYATSQKNDDEALTLLRDVENEQVRASVQSRATDLLTVGVSYTERDRRYPVLGVQANGQRYGAWGRYEQPGIGAASVDFSYSDDDYTDTAGSFRADNATVAARVDFTAIRDLRLTGGVTYLDLGQDLDIEKSILMFEGEYTFAKDYFVEVKYNVYNYDDYILLDRYYTANVVWLNVGYNLSID
jgi:hypothetical protein